MIACESSGSARAHQDLIEHCQLALALMKRTRSRTFCARMPSITASEARRLLYRLIDQVADDHEPLLITGKRQNAVLISEDDWRGIQETLHLISIPGIVESIHEGTQTSPEDMSEDPGW